MTLQTKIRRSADAANMQRKSVKSIAKGQGPWTYVILNVEKPTTSHESK